MSLDKIKAANEQLKQLLEAKDYTNPEIKKLIRTLKLLIFSIPNLPAQPTNLLIEARTFTELNLFYCLSIRNSNELDQAIDSVRFFYENTLPIPQSANHEAFKAIHLLSLISSHRNEEFYTKVENLETFELESKLIQFVLRINDAIEEGNYRKVFKLKRECPLEYFAIFLEKIEDTVRIELAKSSEKAYKVLSVSEALQIFQIENEALLKTFISDYQAEIEDPVVSWKIENGSIVFETTNVQTIKFNSEELIKTGLFYSEELERIA